jgi:hypothetical protein
MGTILKIDRRALLKLGLSTGVLASVPLAGCAVADSTNDFLLEFISDSEIPINSERTGVLNSENFETLASLCDYVARSWRLPIELDTYFGQLKHDLELKTREKPAYLTEYENAVQVVNRVRGELESDDQSWSSLLFAEFSASDLASTRIGRARHFVFSEIIAHQIPISGAFKSFGLVNYRGYFGGPYTLPGSYRRGTV